jgi:NADPH2 dehydrogenase
MTNGYLSSVLDSFAAAAGLAAKAGFDVIQLHAAHGYLLSLLLNPLANCLEGDFRLRGPWLCRLIDSVQDTTKPRLLSVRLSLFSGLSPDTDEEVDFAREASLQLARLGVRVVDYSAGFYTVDKRLIYPGLERDIVPQYQRVSEFAAQLDCLVVFGGNVNDLRLVPPLRHNMLVSVGRALIADPNFIRKSRQQCFDTIVRCRRSGWCHYFSRGKSALECGANPSLGRIA